MIELLKQKLGKEGEQLQHELNVTLPNEIRKAVELGDLRENSEYKAALERQQFVQARLGQLHERLSKLSQIDPSQIPADRVGLGSKVVVKDAKTGVRENYELGFGDALEFDGGQVTMSSPIGRALLGKAVGEVVHLKLPDDDASRSTVVGAAERSTRRPKRSARRLRRVSSEHLLRVSVEGVELGARSRRAPAESGRDDGSQDSRRAARVIPRLEGESSSPHQEIGQGARQFVVHRESHLADGVGKSRFDASPSVVGIRHVWRDVPPATSVHLHEVARECCIVEALRCVAFLRVDRDQIAAREGQRRGRCPFDATTQTHHGEVDDVGRHDAIRSELSARDRDDSSGRRRDLVLA